MIRILHVFGKMNRGGAETFIMNLYRNIDRSKIQFDFAVHSSEVGSYEEEIISLGGKIYRFEKYQGFNHFKYKKRWNKFLKDNKFDIVHCHMKSIAKIILKVANRERIITISHTHNTSFTYKNKLEKIFRLFLMKNISKYSDFRLACGYDAGKFTYKNKPFTILNNGIEINKFRYSLNEKKKLKQKFGFDNKIIYGHVGRFSHQKNHVFLINIFREISLLENNAILILIGEGELKNNILNLVKEYDLDSKVVFLGSVDNVNEYMAVMDLLIFPSRYEGLPVTLVESQFSELKALVSSNITSEIIMSDFIFVKDLNEGAKKWAKKAIEITKHNSNLKIWKKLYDYDIIIVKDKYLEIINQKIYNDWS